MNFTREPIVETVISPKEGHKLVIRNSKGGGQEEFFVDAVQVIVFGNSSFYRSLEKPKSFLLPVSDYEVLEVREARMTLKAAGVEKGIKIAGGKKKAPKATAAETTEATEEQKPEKKREKRRSRKRKEKATHESSEQPPSESAEPRAEKPNLIPPPSTLIAESMAKSKEATPSADEDKSETSKQEEPVLVTPPPPPPLVVPQAEDEGES